MTSNTTQQPPPAPPRKLTETEAESLTHDSYLVQIREQFCHNCTSGERWSEIFEVWTSPAQMRRTSAYVLRPTLTLRAGYAVAYTTLPTVTVPLCSDCVATYNPESGSVIPAASHEAWRETLKRKYEVPPTTERKGRPEPTLDQL